MQLAKWSHNGFCNDRHQYAYNLDETRLGVPWISMLTAGFGGFQGVSNHYRNHQGATYMGEMIQRGEYPIGLSAVRFISTCYRGADDDRVWASRLYILPGYRPIRMAAYYRKRWLLVFRYRDMHLLYLRKYKWRVASIATEVRKRCK